MTQKIFVLPADGIGPEIIAPVKMALNDTLDAILEYVNFRTVDLGGGLSTKAFGQILSDRLSLQQ
jgi:isocitrate/isopropylmalate dehydrogenase